MVENNEGVSDSVAKAENLIESANVASVTVLDHTKVVGTLSSAGIAAQMPASGRSTGQIKAGEIMVAHAVYAYHTAAFSRNAGTQRSMSTQVERSIIVT